MTVAPSWISAVVSPLSSTLIAIDAPTPTSLLPADTERRRRAVFSCLFSARTLTLPVPAVMYAPVGTIAVVWSLTMFSRA